MKHNLKHGGEIMLRWKPRNTQWPRHVQPITCVLCGICVFTLVNRVNDQNLDTRRSWQPTRARRKSAERLRPGVRRTQLGGAAAASQSRCICVCTPIIIIYNIIYHIIYKCFTYNFDFMNVRQKRPTPRSH